VLAELHELEQHLTGEPQKTKSPVNARWQNWYTKVE